ncbi:MAG TPA: DUF1552 domain-containing protein [Vicinamibacterales bacterium]|nr:DUF1552 domain-containing protein [Vicinamibacterales bacterium]
MFITKKALSRRTVLRGMGAVVALPFLDAMVPAHALATETKAILPKTRFTGIEIVHGGAGSTEYGSLNHLWTPRTAGRDFEFTKILQPLEPYRDYLTLITGTECSSANPRSAEEVGADHFRSSAVFLTGAYPKQTEGSDIRNGISIDQLYAAKFGQDTPLPSIQLCIENLDSSGTCGYNYSCAYMDTISWASPTTPLPMTRDPRLAFEELFGSGGSAADRASRNLVNRSILDSITRDISRLRRNLDTRDQGRLNDYLENIREIERRIQKIEAYNVAHGPERELPAAPIGVPDSWEEHVKLMFDLQVLAFAADVTRVSTMKLSRDTSNRVFAESGCMTPWHSASHHGERAETIEDQGKINKYHLTMLAYFVDKLKNTPDGDGNLLDHSLVLYGSPMGDGNVHGHKRVPMVMMGHANGALKGNLHVATTDDPPQANILLTVAQTLGVDIDSVGNSTGTFAV